MTPARFRWGMLFILIGTLLLLVNADVLSNNFWIDFVYLFPFLLIAIGIEKIFSKTRLAVISYLSTVFLVAGAFYVAFEGSRYNDFGSFFQSTTLEYGADPSVDIIDAELDLDRTSLTIRDATDEIMKARFGELTYKPESDMEIRDGHAHIRLSSRYGTRRFVGHAIEIDTGEPDDWRVSFSNEVPLDLILKGRDCNLHLNMASTPLRELLLEAADADVYLKLGELEPHVKVTVTGDDAKLRFRLPQSSGLMVTGVDDPAYLEEIGLVRNNGGYVNENYESAPTRVEIDLNERLRSLSIDFY
jgi:hypothetical protein